MALVLAVLPFADLPGSECAPGSSESASDDEADDESESCSDSFDVVDAVLILRGREGEVVEVDVYV